ncbi:MAG: RNA-binding protein [Candidatus Absconditabacterales bacterium]
MGEENTIISQTKLFVGGLNRKLRGKELREEFSKFGEVAFARVKLDQETNKSRGFGFVEFVNPEDAAKAQKEMNGKELMGRVVNVDFAKENPDRMEKREVREENKEEKNEDDGENLF